MSWCDPLTISVDDYERLFRESPAMQGKGATILYHHLGFEDYCATATELAEKMGYASFSAVNAVYGRLAGRLAREYGWTKEDRKKLRFDWVSFLMSFPGHACDTGHVILQLHPNVAQALLVSQPALMKTGKS